MRYLAAVVVALSAVVVQAEDSVQSEQLTAWANDFAGEWISQSVLEEDAGPVKKGTAFTAHHTYEWSPDHEVLFLKYSADIDGKTFNTTKGIAGWDAAKKAVVVRWFNSLAGSGEFSCTKKGQEWVVDWASVDGDGKRTVFSGSFKVQGDTQHIQMTNRKIGGEAKPDSEMTWKRKS